MAEHRIDVNTATAEELRRVPGIGPVLAERIVSYRGTVGPFVEPSQIAEVPGIGRSSYHAIAEHLTVAAPGEPTASAAVVSPEEPGQGKETTAELASEEVSDPESRPESEEEIRPEVETLPSGEQILEEELTFSGEALEEEPPLEPPQTDEVPEETAEDASAGAGDGAEEGMKEEILLEAEPMPAEDVVTTDVEEEVLVAEVEDQPAVEQRETVVAPSETGLSPAPGAVRPERAPSRSWWRRLSWLWTALLGGLLGLAFALMVLSGINGSLDVGHSRAVLDVKARMDSLTTDIGSLQGDVDGLRKRLDAMEELAVRMDRTEAAVADLEAATAGLSERTDALQARVVALVGEVESISEQLETVQEQAEETRSFFQALRTLLNDFFGDAEGNP